MQLGPLKQESVQILTVESTIIVLAFLCYSFVKYFEGVLFVCYWNCRSC